MQSGVEGPRFNFCSIVWHQPFQAERTRQRPSTPLMPGPLGGLAAKVVEWSIASEASGSRNQDRAEVIQLGVDHLIVLADGAGGMGGGAQAAEAVVSELSHLRPSPQEFRDPLFWNRQLERLDMLLLRDKSAGETTAVIVAVTHDTLVGASCGDSAAHLFGVAAALELTEEQWRKPLLGSGAARCQPFGPTKFTGTLLVCSDGLTCYAPWPSIGQAAVASGVDSAARALTELSQLRSGAFPDDTTAVVMRNV